MLPIYDIDRVSCGRLFTPPDVGCHVTTSCGLVGLSSLMQLIDRYTRRGPDTGGDG